MERGLDIHKKAENYVNGKITGLPNELVKFKDEFISLKKEYKAGNGFTEPDVSYNSIGKRSNGKMTDYFIGYADFLHFEGNVCTIIDYKTGKAYDEHREQGHAYGTACMVIEPAIEQVNVEFWYIDQGTSRHFEWTNKEIVEMQTLWEKRINKMYADTFFKKTPNRFCNWCQRNKKHGGDCDG